MAKYQSLEGSVGRSPQRSSTARLFAGVVGDALNNPTHNSPQIAFGALSTQMQARNLPPSIGTRRTEVLNLCNRPGLPDNGSPSVVVNCPNYSFLA